VATSGAIIDRARAAAASRIGFVTHQPLLRAAARRLVLSIPLVLVVSALIFVLTSVMPGDITEVVLGPRAMSGRPLSEYVALRHRLGLDVSLPQRYWDWLTHALHGDLGASLFTGESIEGAIGHALPVTCSLIAGALLVSLVLGVGLGIVSAVRGGAVGRIVDVFAMAGWVLPVYWIAAEAIVIFAVLLHWLPVLGYVPFSESPGDWARSLVLPVAALAVGPLGAFAKFTREAMLDAMASEYIRAARANGISSLSIIFVDALKTASIQVLTLSGLTTIGLILGTVFVERVFALQGLGALMTNGVSQHDIPMVEGVGVVFTLIVVAVNLITDLAYSLLNPKVRPT
jgi:peptide/nickel transport system permease protein